jgi:hypothetical protein
MHDRGAGFDRADRGVGDLLRSDRMCGDIVGVWIEPVTAQVMTTLLDVAMDFPRASPN